MSDKRLSYYNYFLILSIFLIAGYFLTSLFFINKTSASGEKADVYAEITEKADGILKSAYKMEAVANSYLLTNSISSHEKYDQSKEELKQHYKKMQSHCTANELAGEHLLILGDLIEERISQVKHLVASDSSHTMHNDQRIEVINHGKNLMDEITVVLNDIRSISAKIRDEKRMEGNTSTQNALFMLSVFGFVMLIIVIISFSKMKTEILQNEAKTREISQINNALKGVNENLENFAYIASHDLNEPLRKIRTFGDLAKDEFKLETPDTDTIKDHLGRMQNASERMQQLINDLLSYSRVDRNYDDSKAIDLNKVVDEVKSDLQFAIKDKNAKVIIQNPPKSIHVDALQMRQLIQNLISNALKFSRSEVTPKINISAEKVDSDSVPLAEDTLLVAKKYWKIEVADNGIGFEQQYAEKIFSVFHRLHGRSKYEGTGIGLSICKKIVDQHQGIIKANSKVGEGATFSIYIPVFNA